MVWARLDDQILDNPKIAKAGVFGFALHVAAITWCCRNLTDGFIPTARVTALLTLSRVHIDVANPLALIDGPSSMAGDEGLDALKVADHLVAVELWRAAPGGYELNDFLEYNPSRSDVEKKRAGDSERQERSRSKRRSRTDSRSESHVTSHRDSRVTSGVNPRLPDPDPDPLRDPPLPPKGEPGIPSGPRTVQESKVILVTGDRSANDGDMPDEPASGVHFAIGTAASEVAKATYEQAVSDATGEPFVLVDWRKSASAIVTAINAHGRPKTKQEGLSWLRNQVSRWVSENKHRPQFVSGWKPGAFVDWLNAGCPKPILATGTGDGSARPSRRPFKDLGSG